MKLAILAATGAAALAFASSASAIVNYVSDGDFSSPSGGASYTPYGGGSSMGPWTVGGNSVDLIGGYWQNPNGTAGSVDLDGSAPGSISQSLSLIAGDHYTLTFYLSGNPDGNIGPHTVDVSVGNLVGDAFTYTTGSNSRTSMNYALETVNFTATATNVLSFSSADASGAYGPVVGDISVTAAVPEPATWALMLAGFGGLGLALRGRRRFAIA
ncbi:MAG TPA: choice-of-anchor C family protein [Caulobacteraceae bacterium]